MVTATRSHIWALRTQRVIIDLLLIVCNLYINIICNIFNDKCQIFSCYYFCRVLDPDPTETRSRTRLTSGAGPSETRSGPD